MVKTAAASVLGEKGYKAAVEALKEALKDKDNGFWGSWYKEKGAYALGEIGDRAAIKALKEALSYDTKDHIADILEDCCYQNRKDNTV